MGAPVGVAPVDPVEVPPVAPVDVALVDEGPLLDEHAPRTKAKVKTATPQVNFRRCIMPTPLFLGLITLSPIPRRDTNRPYTLGVK